MKKILSLLMAIIISIVPVGVFADSNESAKIEKVLIAVKSKITVPETLSDFDGYITKGEEKEYYHFEWSDEDDSEVIMLSADGNGRIENYYQYKDNNSDKKISSFSKDDIVTFASKFILKALPETFNGEGDVLVFDEKSYDAQNSMRYTMTFNRKKELAEVKDNYAVITIGEADGELFVRNMSVTYDYDAEFDLSGDVAENYVEKYKTAYPAELVYVNEYTHSKDDGKDKIIPSLVYRIKDNNIGYIDAATGEITQEDVFDGENFKESPESMNDMLMGSGEGGSDVLTEEELKELSRIEGILGEDDIKKIIKKLPHVNFSNDMKLISSGFSKNNEGEYIYSLYFANNKDEDYQYLEATVKAESGKILNFSASTKYTDNGKLSDNELKTANKKIAEFVEVVAGTEIIKCKEEKEYVNKRIVNKFYVRYVNGVKYADNGIRVAFDAEGGNITHFSANFTDGDFLDPETAIGIDEAYDKILEYAPIVPLYIMNGGKYRKVFTLDSYGIEIDAVTAKLKNGNEAEDDYSYSDIEGHWAEEAAVKLAELQIGFPGGKLEPKKQVTQKEFLHLITCGVYGKYLADYSEDVIYELLRGENLIKGEEVDPDSPVAREDAFKFIIRFADLEKVALLKDIYKVNYSDGHLLSEDKIGYAAILSGLGVIDGNGGKIRPKDYVTRAEAVTMLYKYLLNF